MSRPDRASSPALERPVEDARIVAIEAIPIALPVRREWRWRGLSESLGRWVIVRIETDAGVNGVGEANPLADWGGDYGRAYGETPVTVRHVVEDLLAPAIAGLSVWESGEIDARMAARVRGHPYAKAAIDIALWDVRGKLAAQPIYRLLGGKRRDRVRVAHMIGIMARRDSLEEARAAVAEGVMALQVKVTGEPRDDAEAVAALRAELSSDVWLRVDVNQGYRTLSLKRAIMAVRDLAVAGADMVEQPTEGLERMARIRGAVDIPLIADESCWQTQDVVEVAQAAAADAISVYVAKAGGLAAAQAVAMLAETFHLPCDVNGSLESGIGTAASLHLATACSAISLPAVIPVPRRAGDEAPQFAGRYYSDDVAYPALRFEDGALIVPDGPGLGIEVDEEKLEAMRVGGR